MASASSIAIRTSQAQARLLAAAEDISRLTGAPALEWPRHKDPDILRALEIETAAALLESAVAALSVPAPAPKPKRER